METIIKSRVWHRVVMVTVESHHLHYCTNCVITDVATLGDQYKKELLSMF